MIFSKEEQTIGIIGFLRFFQETKRETWKHQPDAFKLLSIFILAIRTHGPTHIIIVSENW